jgi:hypothetical protein
LLNRQNSDYNGSSTENLKNPETEYIASIASEGNNEEEEEYYCEEDGDDNSDEAEEGVEGQTTYSGAF